MSGCPQGSFQSLLVEPFSGADIVDNLPEGEDICYVRDTRVIAVEESSSTVRPHRTATNEMIHGLLLHGAVRAYLRDALRFVFIQVIIQLAVAREVLRGCPEFVFAKIGEGFRMRVAPHCTEVRWHVLYPFPCFPVTSQPQSILPHCPRNW